MDIPLYIDLTMDSDSTEEKIIITENELDHSTAPELIFSFDIGPCNSAITILESFDSDPPKVIYMEKKMFFESIKQFSIEVLAGLISGWLDNLVEQYSAMTITFVIEKQIPRSRNSYACLMNCSIESSIWTYAATKGIDSVSVRTSKWLKFFEIRNEVGSKRERKSFFDFNIMNETALFTIEPEWIQLLRNERKTDDLIDSALQGLYYYYMS